MPLSSSFIMLFRSEEGERLARIAIESLHAFGGPLRDCPVWAFVLDPDRAAQALPGMDQVQRFPLEMDADRSAYPFAEKVYACARAEAMAAPETHSLTWLSLDSLVVNPPRLIDLGLQPDAPEADAAFRPVHHRDIGLLVHEPLDDFWRGIYNALNLGETAHTVESFVDRQTLRPYFNTHCLAFNPALGLVGNFPEAGRRPGLPGELLPGRAAPDLPAPGCAQRPGGQALGVGASAAVAARVQLPSIPAERDASGAPGAHA